MEPQAQHAAPVASMSLSIMHRPPPVGAAGTARTPLQPKPWLSARSGGVRSHPIQVPLASAPALGAPRALSAPAQRGRGLRRMLSSLLGGPRPSPSQPQVFAPHPGALSDMRVFPSMVHRKAAPGNGGRPGAAGARKACVVWFRNDLRVHDNHALASANAEGSSVLPVYIFDPRDYGKSAAGFDKTGPFRAQFILDSVADLRARLRGLGSELLLRVGRPEEVVPALVRAVGAGAVHCHCEVSSEEAQVEAAVRRAVEREGAQLKAVWGGTLYHPEDLPFRLDTMPTTYADFRAKLRGTSVRAALERVDQLKGLPLGKPDAGKLPSLRQLGLSGAPGARVRAPGVQAAAGKGPQGALGGELRGGEAEALRHLQGFLQELKSTLSRGSAGQPGSATSSISSHFSCKISPWLAMGCLSPRYMYEQLQQQLGAALGAAGGEATAASGGSAGASGASGGQANWLVFELLWRDFFRFITQKYTGMQQAGASGLKPEAAAAPLLAAA